MKHGWEYKKLGEVASYINGFAFKPEQWTTEGVPIIRIQNLNNPDAPFNYYDGVVPEKVRVANGDLLISWSASLGTYIWEGGDAYLNQHIFKVEFDKGNIDKMYLKYAVSSKLDAMANLVHGATMKHIVKKDFDNTLIPVPPLPNQRQIVSLLDKLNLVIEKKKEQVRQLDNLAQAIFYDMFGDALSNDKGFEQVSLNDVCTLITDGTHQTPQYTEDKENGFKFLSAKDVVGGKINWENIKYIPEALHNVLYARLSPRRNDILLCKNGTTGIAAIVETDEVFDIYVSLALLRLKDGILPKYILFAINNKTTKQQFDGSLKGIGVPNLHLGEIRKAKILLPPLSLQQAFAQKVEAIERQKELINQSIAEVQTLFDSQMDYYFGE